MTAATERQIWLVRHGETAWSRSGQHTGRTDIPLTDEGRDQGRALGRLPRDRSFALVLTSPLSRAADTARLAGFGERAQADDDLAELTLRGRGFGEVAGDLILRGTPATARWRSAGRRWAERSPRAVGSRLR